MGLIARLFVNKTHVAYTTRKKSILLNDAAAFLKKN
jgi:hypothetical protein